MIALPREFSLRAVPEELRMRYQREGLWTDDTLGALIDTSVRARPALAFRIWSERRPCSLPLGAVHEQARRLAAGMRARGLGPGDVVAFQLPNWTEAAASFFGLSMLGAVVVPIVHSYGPREVHLESAGLARPKWPEELRTVDEFPRTPAGKIKKFVLRETPRATPGRRGDR